MSMFKIFESGFSEFKQVCFFFLSDFNRGRQRLELRWDGLYFCSQFSLCPINQIIHLHSLICDL